MCHSADLAVVDNRTISVINCRSDPINHPSVLPPEPYSCTKHVFLCHFPNGLFVVCPIVSRRSLRVCVCVIVLKYEEDKKEER